MNFADWHTWTQAIDIALLWQLLVCVAFSLVVGWWPQLRSSRKLVYLGFLATAVSYRHAVTGYLLIHLAAYAVIAGLAWGGGWSKNQRQSRWFWAAVAMVALSGIFLAGRQYGWDNRPVEAIGMQVIWYSLNMWAFLRLLTLLWEFGSGRIQRPDLRSYLVWCCLPFTLVGPLLRYSDFAQQIAKSDAGESRESWWSGTWARNLLIAAGQMLLGISLSGVQLYLGNNLAWWDKLVLWFVIAPWSFYLLLGGYFRMMEYLAVCWGLKLSPSFMLPFGRRNISEFWANWNMTATAVFRDYFFYNRWGMKRINVYLNTLILFVLVGLWHGANGYWVIWGLLHGVGFSLFLWYKANRQRFNRWNRPELERPIRFVSAVATYVFVCSCWVLPPQLLKLIVR